MLKQQLQYQIDKHNRVYYSVKKKTILATNLDTHLSRFIVVGLGFSWNGWGTFLF